MKIPRRPFLKLILASVAGWFSNLSASAEPFSNRKPTLLSFYSPCRIWVSESVPSLTPKSAKYWLKISTGEVFKFDGNSWINMQWSRRGREVAIEGKDIGWIANHPEHNTHDWSSFLPQTESAQFAESLPKLPREAFLVKCESCELEIDLEKPKIYSRIERRQNGELWEHIHHAWDNIPIEVDGTIRYWRLCETCLEKATNTYDL